MKTIIHHHTILDDVNFLTALNQYSCTPSGDPFVVIKTAFAAGVPTLYAFNQFSCLDIVALRAGITWKCGKKLKPIARQGIPPWAGAATDFLYRLGPAQLRLGLWYYFVASEVTHFLARWTSMLYVQQGCTAPPDGACSVPASIGAFGVLFPLGSNYVTALNACHTSCGTCSGRDISVFAGCQVTIIPMVSWKPALPDEPPSNLTVQVIAKASGDVVASLSTNANADTGAGNGYVFAPNLHGGLLATEVFNVLVLNPGPGIIIQTEVSLTIQWSGYKSEVVPAGCIPKPAHL
jgi:hypothetical protein